MLVAGLEFALVAVEFFEAEAKFGRHVGVAGEDGLEIIFKAADTVDSPAQGSETVSGIALHIVFRAELGFISGADLFEGGALFGAQFVKKSGFAII